MNEPRHPGLADADSRRRRTRRGLALLALLVAACGLVAARPLAMRAPRPQAEIERVLADGPHHGECERCHTAHGDDAGIVYPGLLVSPDENELCGSCHQLAWSGGSWAGEELLRATGHGSGGGGTAWPGPSPPARVEVDATGKCVNCHDPHGVEDAQGSVSHLTLQREEKLCLTCHDGSPSSLDIAADLAKPYRHPVAVWTDRHRGADEGAPADFGRLPEDRRHAECTDCHNPHVSRADGAGGTTGNEASKTTLGVSRVAVLNGPAGSPPLYTFIAGSDTLTAPHAEYQLCFKCHSSWTTQPSGQTDLALVLNPANPSHHAVEAPGNNPGIDPQAFAPGWNASSVVRCGDCHGSDFGSARGPHGSTYPRLLRAAYYASAAARPMSSDELCFRCHSHDVYANGGSPESARARSRFNSPGAGAGHVEHVAEHQVPCYACHVTHGSTTLPFLLVTGRLPGLTSFSSTPAGGTCSSSCHGSRSYTVNYAR